MTTYRTGTHHGITICAENDGARCGREGHDCARGHLVAVVVDGGVELAERICQLLNGPPYPKRCTMEPGVRGCYCEPWADCYKTRRTPDVDHARGAAEALALVAERIADRVTDTGAINLRAIREILEGVAAELGVGEDAPAARASLPVSAEQVHVEGIGYPEPPEPLSARLQTPPADSCTCVYWPNGVPNGGPDPNCVVHHGRRARGPKPPPLGPGCVCDGSGRTCPRHGAVI